MNAMISLENFRLTVFRKVAQQLSFRKAAEDLYLTQPAISQQIKALEEELNVVLFDRSGAQVKLTPAGEVLLEFADESSRLLHRASESLAQLSGTQTGSLSLGASTTVAQYVLPALLSEFCAAHPRVRPTLISGNTEQIVTAAEHGKVDIGFIEGPPRSRDISAAPFLQDELVLLVPAAHEWTEQQNIVPADLASVPLLMRERGSGTRHIIEMALAHHGVRRSALKIVMELDSTEAIKSAVEAGFGVGFVSRWAIRKDGRLGPSFRIVPIEGLSLRRQFIAILPKRHPLPATVEEFRNFVFARTVAKAPRRSLSHASRPGGHKQP